MRPLSGVARIRYPDPRQRDVHNAALPKGAARGQLSKYEVCTRPRRSLVHEGVSDMEQHAHSCGEWLLDTSVFYSLSWLSDHGLPPLKPLRDQLGWTVHTGAR